jgi:hypothetical protein
MSTEGFGTAKMVNKMTIFTAKMVNKMTIFTAKMVKFISSVYDKLFF